MTELKSCPFCKVKPERIKVEKTWDGKIPPDIKHPPSKKCYLGNMSFYDDEWQSRPLESALEAQVGLEKFRYVELASINDRTEAQLDNLQSRLKEVVGDIEATVHNEESDWNAPNFKERRDGRINGLKMALNIFLIAFPELEKKK